MKQHVRLILAQFLILWPFILVAQPGRPSMVFGEITPDTFAPSTYPLDSSANAVILFDQAHVNFGRAKNNLFGFSIIYERHTRIRLLHKNAFGLTNVILSRSTTGTNGIEFEKLKGATYNLEEGKLVTTKLDKSNIFKEENGGFEMEKMIFPNVKEGSVIEYSYRIIYPGFGYMPFWDFQGEYPILWSEYDITIPSLLEYVIEKQGYLKFTVDSAITTTQILPINFPSTPYSSSVSSTWTGDATERIWAIKNVPALARREAYITTLKNYVSRIEFQLSAIHMQNAERTIRSTWDQLVDELMKNENFGVPLLDDNHWMTNELKKITGTDQSSLQAVEKIYAFVRDHFDCSGIEIIYSSQSIKKTWEDKKGNVADINLLLTALYKHEGFEAEPVLLSTRSHGTAIESYPMLKDYNYVITRIKVGDRNYLLDASKNNVGFGQLPEICYNGSGRIIDADHFLIPLSADSLTEKRVTSVFLVNNDSLGYSGSFNHTAGTFESMELRSRLKRITPEEFFEDHRKTMAAYKTMLDGGIDSLDRMEDPVGWHYNMKYLFTNSTIYFNPVMHERMNTNPFSPPERHYPVEMPYREDYTYNINMEIPNGYTVDQVPRSERALLDSGNSGMFEYLVEADSERIQLRYRLRIKKTQFNVEEYKSLRDFFAFIIRKEKEEIVFKKK